MGLLPQGKQAGNCIAVDVAAAVGRKVARLDSQKSEQGQRATQTTPHLQI